MERLEDRIDKRFEKVNQRITNMQSEIRDVRSEMRQLNQNHIDHLSHHESRSDKSPKAGTQPHVSLVMKLQKWGFEGRNALKDPNKERDNLCKQIDRAIDELTQVKKAIEHDNMNEASKFILSLKATGVNLPNRIKEYIDQSNIRSAHNIR